jgi:hypothetical protein
VHTERRRTTNTRPLKASQENLIKVSAVMVQTDILNGSLLTGLCYFSKELTGTCLFLLWSLVAKHRALGIESGKNNKI